MVFYQIALKNVPNEHGLFWLKKILHVPENNDKYLTPIGRNGYRDTYISC